MLLLHIKATLTRSRTMASICVCTIWRSLVGPSRAILSSPSVNSICTWTKNVQDKMYGHINGLSRLELEVSLNLLFRPWASAGWSWPGSVPSCRWWSGGARMEPTPWTQCSCWPGEEEVHIKLLHHSGRSFKQWPHQRNNRDVTCQNKENDDVTILTNQKLIRDCFISSVSPDMVPSVQFEFSVRLRRIFEFGSYYQNHVFSAHQVNYNSFIPTAAHIRNTLIILHVAVALCVL